MKYGSFPLMAAANLAVTQVNFMNNNKNIEILPSSENSL